MIETPTNTPPQPIARLFREAESAQLRRWPEWAQILLFTAVALLINIVIGLLIHPLGLTDTVELKQEINENQGLVAGIILVVVAGPMMETFVGQFFPLFFAKIVRRNRITQLLWASIWFSALHVASGPSHVIQSFFFGWVFAVCFLFCWAESWFKAVRVTYLVHALHNAIIYGIFLLSTL